MAEQIITTGLQTAPLIHKHYRKVWDPVRNNVRKMTGEYRDDPDIRDTRTPEDKGYVLRRRSQVGPDEQIVDTVRHRGEVKGRRPGRPGTNRRRSSYDDGLGKRGLAAGAGAGAGAGAAGYESEGSVPPRARTRARSQGEKSKRGSSSSSTSSSDLASSTDEENQARKMGRKKWLTAALASVATIHAASKVYSSIEAHDKRIIEVQQGKMSPEEAHKKQRAARWQDAAAIGIAALGIKGAISEWNEMAEEHEHHKEFLAKKEEHHKKRLERMRRDRARSAGGGYYKGRDGEWYYDGEEWQDSQRSTSRQVDGPRNGDRKMLEDRARSRGRSDYDNNNRSDYRSRSGRSARSARSSRYNYDDGDYDFDA